MRALRCGVYFSGKSIMLLTLIRKEIMHHILSVRFIALLLMCLLLLPLTLSMGYHDYCQNLENYQEAVKLTRAVAEENPELAPGPNVEVSRLFLKPTPLSVFSKGLEESLPSYLGMTRNGIIHGSTGLSEVPLSSALGHLDFLFLVSTVFSLLALLFTFDAIAGEKEVGTLRIILANAIPRDLFLWSKLIGGYLVFVVPFLVSFIVGLLLLVWQGIGLGEPDIFPRVLSLLFVSLLYIAVFFTLGAVISTYLDRSKTALIVAFTVWVFAVLIAPRIGFLTAKFIVPTRAVQSVYMEKTVIRNNLNAEKTRKLGEKIRISLGSTISFTDENMAKITELRAPIDAEYQQKFQERAEKIDRAYQREKARQERLGETLSRITPTSPLIYITMNLAETGKVKRDIYFLTGTRYYNQLDAEYFTNISDDDFAMLIQRSEPKAEEITPPPKIEKTPLSETLRHSMVDLLTLCLFTIVFTTIAALKFSRIDI